ALRVGHRVHAAPVKYARPHTATLHSATPKRLKPRPETPALERLCQGACRKPVTSRTPPQDPPPQVRRFIQRRTRGEREARGQAGRNHGPLASPCAAWPRPSSDRALP